MADDNLLANSRVCTRCLAHKPHTMFFREPQRKDGLSPRCKSCRAEIRRAAAWPSERPEALAKRAAEYRAANPEAARAQGRANYYRSRKENSARALAYYHANKPLVREYQREAYRRDPARRLRIAMSTGIRKSLRDGKRGRSWEALAGYSAAELMVHLERQFTRGMSWANSGEWHIDHIIPLASFDITSADGPEFRAAWALTNLRPLWARENISKHAKRLTLL